MNGYALVPLFATIAFMGPLVALLLHRPRSAQNVLFLLFTCIAMLWSLSDFILRAGLIPTHQLALVKVIICLAVLMTIQFHRLLRSFAGRRDGWALLDYLPLAAILGLTLSDLVPQSVEVSHEVADVRYGPWMLPVVLVLAAFIVHDAYLLLQKYRTSARLLERNQLAYLLVATLADGLLIAGGFSPWGTTYAAPHVGNLAAALILAYAMIVGNLADIGVTVRRALVGFWLIASAGILYVVLMWAASVVFGFGLSPTLITAGGLATLICFIFVYCTSAYSRRTVEWVVLGKRMKQREELSRFLTTQSVIADFDEFGRQLLALLAGSTGSGRAWLLLPSSKSADFEVRCSYATDVALPPPLLSLAHDSQLVTSIKRESRPLSGGELRNLLKSCTVGSMDKQALESAEVEMILPSICQGRLVAIVALGQEGRRWGLHS